MKLEDRKIKNDNNNEVESENSKYIDINCSNEKKIENYNEINEIICISNEDEESIEARKGDSGNMPKNCDDANN